MYTSYAGKLRTNSNVAWHRPQSTSCRLDEELKQKSARSLLDATEPLDKLRLLCLSRGASGIMYLGKTLRKMDVDGTKQLDKEQFFNAIKETELEISDEDVASLFTQFDKDGSVNVDEFIGKIRPLMSDNRRAILEQAFDKLDKTGDGVITVEDFRAVYSVNENPRYKNGEETEDVILDKFMANFEQEGDDGSVTREEFMNYYSGISVSIEKDCLFDLMMRQAYKL